LQVWAGQAVGEIYRALEALAKYLGADPIAVGILLVLPLALMYFRFKYHQDVLKSPRGLAGVRERLTLHGNWRSAYFDRLRRVLVWVDCHLGQSAWSADSYAFTLNMAFLYPFASLFIIWIVTGQNTSGIPAQGFPGQLPGSTPLSVRALFLLAICTLAIAFLLGRATSSGWRDLVNFVVQLALFVVGISAFSFAVVMAIPFGSALFMIAAVVAALVVAAVAEIKEKMARRGLRSIFYIIFLLAMLGLQATAISNPGWFHFKNESDQSIFVFILIFLVFLPLTNSIFDWLSLAATRALLKGMAERDDTPALQVAGNALLGLFLGVLLLAGLAAAATAGLQTMNHLSQGHGGPEFFDLAGTLHRLRVSPTDPAVWWVYFTLFSTMLPTVFHAAIASASFVTWRLPDSWKRHWLALLGTGDIKDDHPVLVGMAWRLTLMDAATVLLAALSAAILAWLLLWLMPLEGGGLLWLCERVAEWLGAPIQI
jgi:hypothetical protein